MAQGGASLVVVGGSSLTLRVDLGFDSVGKETLSAALYRMRSDATRFSVHTNNLDLRHPTLLYALVTTVHETTDNRIVRVYRTPTPASPERLPKSSTASCPHL